MLKGQSVGHLMFAVATVVPNLDPQEASQGAGCRTDHPSTCEKFHRQVSEMAGVFASEDSHVLSVRTWVFIPVSLSDHLLVTSITIGRKLWTPAC